MKTFKELIAEVAQPLSQGEKNFKALHTIDHKNLVPGVTDQEHVFKGNARREDPATASYENFRDDDESVEAYDKGIQVTPSAPERDIDEETSMNEGLGSSTIKHKQKLSHMDDKAFAAHADSAGWKEKDLRAMAWRHGFGKPGTAGHEHYVKRYNKGLNEEVEQVEEKEANQYIEVTNKHTGAKKHIEVHPSKAYAALNQYRNANSTARIVSKPVKEDVELEEAAKKSGLDKHFEKQSKKMQDAINMHLRKGKDYPTAFAAAKKHVKEDVEQIDELSKKTLGNYVNAAAANVADKNYMAGRIDAAGKKSYVPKSYHDDASEKLFNKGLKRLGNVQKAVTKLTKEEIEELAEKVKTTHEDPLVTVHDKHGLHTHANLSTANKIFNTKVKHTDVHAGAVKTKDGHETKNNLTFAISKHHASAMKEEAEQLDELSPATLSSYKTKAASSEKAMTDKSSSLSVPAKDRNAAAIKANQRRQGMKLASSKMDEDVELEEKTLTPAEMKKREEIAKAMERENPGMPMAKKMAIATAQAKKVAEETVYEEDDFDYEGEMARAELNAICDKAGVLAEMLEDDTQLEAWLQSKITKAKYMIDSVYDYMIYSNKSSQDKPMPATTSDYSQAGNMAANYGSFLNRMGEETELDEARRGRPRKDGSSSNDEEGGREHIIVQLRKANNLRGERHTEFNDNSKHKLPLSHVKKALDMHRDMKPQQKAEFEARLAKSHASFHDAVSGKPAEPAKPKVTLAKSAAHMKEALADPSSMRSDRGDVKPVTVMGKGGRLEVIKRQSARKEINVGESVEMNTANVKKAVKHDCAKHVEHAEWGVGQCITGEHTIVETSEGNGFVSHYDVMFEHGIERDVPVQSLNILVSETHEHTRKMSEELKGDQHKIDANKNGKVDAHDFKILRGKTKFTAKLNFKKTRPAFKEEAELDETVKVNMQQDSVDKIKKDPLASKEALKLPPTQGNQPIGGEGEIAKGIVEELLNRLYESLSEDNKKIFEQKYQTEEGKLELLAFAEEQGL